MFIQEIVVDGFKSYASRTVIGHFDPEFNAITGLNGSGKSNILDAICFVLGISNLSQVRASNLSELVYKQGQGGVTKATVSIVFNNADTKASPIGYEHCETITVSRTVVIGGRNKYLINGHTVQATAVQNLFHSVQLNVNNPHFLIMQGRITKVLNMKPPEILSMVEEAAGTRMFETKKQGALKTIEKKQTKVEEIDRILATEITPTLEKLRSERKAYLEWSKINTDCERLARFCVAHEYTKAGEVVAAALEGRKAVEAGVRASRVRLEELAHLIAAKGREIAERDAALAAASGGVYKRLAAEHDVASKEQAKLAAALENQRKTVKSEEKAHAAALAALTEAQATVVALQRSVNDADASVSKAAAAAETSSAAVAALTTSHNAAIAGLNVDTTGASTGTLADQLVAAKARVVELSSQVASAELQVTHSRAMLKDADKAARAASKELDSMKRAMASATSAVETKRARMAALRFNPAEEESLRVRREALAADIAAEVDRVDADAGAVAAATAFHYDAHALGAGWDASRVKGTVASLLSLRRADAATALEVAAGGKLYQVVVDSELTGKALLERGRLRRRVTLIPLNKVKRNTLHRDKVALAASISHGAAVPALDCIDFPEEVRPAMEYVFGSMFVCANAEVAKAITFNPRINAPSVTLDGDVFDPAGTLEGGSKPEVGGSPLLLRISNARNGQASLDAKRAALATVEQQLTAMSAAAKQYHALCADVDMAVHEAELLTTRLSKSEAGMAEQRAADAAAGVSQAEEQLAAVKAELVQASAAARSLEAAAANASKAREARIAALNAELKTAKISATRASDALSKQQQAASALRCDLEAAMKEVDSLQQRAADAGASVATTSAALANAQAAFARANAELERTAAALTAERNALAAADAAVKELRRQRDALSAEQEQAEGSIKRADGQLKTFEREAKAAERLQHELLGKHSWIEAERSFFGRPHSDFDFSANDPRACAAELTALEKRQAELDRKINKKVIGMVEQAERECADLLSKKRIIENDKSKIERVIAELDEKKNEALRTTWTKVNVDFGSIFSTLLPGVTAKLDPPEGGTVLDGLEVKVAFNGVWKESLTELSGGQRSLLALSLILALLLFKPAPMYILDEVDAALDLSHTQNIGRMIKTHFTKSQFIVVSLKQGMFGNANVIFRTLFVEGKGSTVTRTVPAPSAGAGSAAAATSEAPAARRGKATAHAGAAPAGDELLENSSARGGSAAAAAPKRRALPPAVDTPMAGAGAASSGRHEL